MGLFSCCCPPAAADEDAGVQSSGGLERQGSGVSTGAGRPPHPGIKRELSKRKLTALEQETLEHLADAQIIEHEDDVFKTDFSDGSMPPLHSQARKGNHDAVEKLLLLDRDNKTPSIVYGSRTPLHQAAAAKQGRYRTCQLLLDAAPNQMQVKTKDGRSPLHMAAESDCEEREVTRLLIDRGGKALLHDARFGDGATCMHMACAAGRAGMVEVLVAEDSTLAGVDNASGLSCLHAAAESGHEEVVKILLRTQGVKIDKADRSGNTALHYAAMGGFPGIVRELLKAEPRLIEIKNKEDKTCFDSCVDHGKTSGHWKAAKALLEADSSLVKPGIGPDNMNALHHAAKFGQVEGVKMLVQMRPELITAKTASGDTCLHLASREGHAEVLRFLLAQPGGQDLAASPTNSPNSCNCLHLACEGGHMAVAEALIEAQPALLKAKDGKGRTCLGSASLCKKPNVKLVKLLLQKEPALLWDTDDKGNTVLHKAAQGGDHEDLVWLFGETGQTKLIKTKNQDGETSLDVAAPNIQHILEDLMEREADDKKAAEKGAV